MIRHLVAEWLGAVSLLAAVIGSGIMAERRAEGSIATAPLGNTIPTGAILAVLILVFGPILGAHFNPAMTIARGFSNTFAGIRPADITAFVAVQLVAAVLATYFFNWLLEEKSHEKQMAQGKS